MGEWRQTTLGALCAEGGGGIQTGPFGSQLHASDYVADGVPSVMPLNIGDNVIIENGIARITASDAQRLSRYLLAEGDIVYSRRGDVEKRALVRAKHTGWLCGTGCLRVRLGKSTTADPRFISYLLGTEESRGWIVRHAVGATMPNLNTAILGAVPLVIPDPLEQWAIANVLGALDDKIAANIKVANRADALAQSLFEASAGEPGATMSTLSSQATVVLGGTPDRGIASYWTDGDVPWLNSGKANERRVLEPSEWITEEALARSAAKLMPRRSTVVAITGATLGKVARMEIAASGNQSLVGIWSEDDALNDWLYFAVRSEIPRLLQAATGAAQQHVNKRDVELLKVPVPSGDLLDDFGRQVRPLLDLAAERERENLTLAATRDALLPALMSGALRVRDAEWAVSDQT